MTMHSIPQGGYAFVLNPLHIAAPLPIEIVPNAILQRPNSEQLQNIKDRLKRLSGISSWRDASSSLYECETIKEDTPQGVQFRQIKLSEAEWRYYIVSTKDNGLTAANVQYASNLTKVPLELSGLNFFGGGVGTQPATVLNRLFSSTTVAPRVERTMLNEVTEAYHDFINVAGGISGKSEFPELSRAVQAFDSLRLLPPSSDFHVVGLFAIVEMLITHNPKLEDRGDSIGHQMRTKIPLLSRRFKEPLRYRDFFDDDSDNKIWNALYSYRSSIAHGGSPDFSTKELRILKDSPNAHAFLRDAVRGIIRHSLREPMLYRDLKEC
jgi:hypothetical protein